MSDNVQNESLFLPKY